MDNVCLLPVTTLAHNASTTRPLRVLHEAGRQHRTVFSPFGSNLAHPFPGIYGGDMKIMREWEYKQGCRRSCVVGWEVGELALAERGTDGWTGS